MSLRGVRLRPLQLRHGGVLERISTLRQLMKYISPGPRVCLCGERKEEG